MRNRQYLREYNEFEEIRGRSSVPKPIESFGDAECSTNPSEERNLL
jgi:hypothetical protein